MSAAATPGGAARAARRSALGAYAVTAALALAIALGSFVLHRNRSYREREHARARAAAEAIARGERPAAHLVAGGLVSAAQPSARYPFLRRRLVDGRPLGGPGAPPGDKILYDAAQRAEREGAQVRFADPDGALVLAARPAEGGVAVALVEAPGGPAGLPVGLLAGLLLLGALVAAGGAAAGPAPRALGLAIGGGALAAPSALWGGPAAAALVAAVALAGAAADRLGLLARAGA
ncbi:MAG TPA: hypothetical protein VKZ63_14325, partial [Kofleriaceae bacterium]|nr:hypothetical protein [Kofleriaceae bacterium]